MNLTTALRVATNSLANNSRQVSTISQNINGVGNPDYVRREAELKSGPLGFQTVDVVRRIDRSLSEALGVAISKKAYQQVVVRNADRLSTMLGTGSADGSLSAKLGSLKDSLELAASSPSDTTSLSMFVENARELANSINDSYAELLRLRQEADQKAAAGVARINDTLARIKDLNDEIVTRTQTGGEAHDSMDQRDKLIAELAEEIGISVRNRENNDIAIYTNSGLTLFDRVPRTVEFDPIGSYGPATTGNALFIDGVPATGSGTGLAVNSGATIGQIQARDGAVLDQMKRLDELSRGLVEAFAETDRTGGGKPALAGLFTWSGGPALPPSGTLETGMALGLKINPAVDPQAGGDPFLIRDGGINGDPDYIENTGGAAGYSDRLLVFSAALSSPRSFDPQAGLSASTGLDAYADSIVGALEQMRQDQTGKLEYRTELRSRLEASLRLETGPNLDFEMSQLLEVERAYQASAQLIAAVDELLDTLMASIR